MTKGPAVAYLDTNVLLRFLTGQPPDLAARARSLIKEAEAGKVVLRLVCGGGRGGLGAAELPWL